MPIDLDTLLIFIPVALALNLTPGADMLFCLGQGIKSGPKAGLTASIGIATGSFIHAFFAGVGLAAMIASHPFLFEVIRWAGVGYLIWLAISSLRKPFGTNKTAITTHASALMAWRNGIFVCLLNPKVALFILALVPQFVDVSRGSIFVQFLIFGTILNIGGTIINGLVGVFAGSIGQFLTRNRLATRILQYTTSLIFFGLAARLAFDRK